MLTIALVSSLTRFSSIRRNNYEILITMKYNECND
jgi:hypothetical protein